MYVITIPFYFLKRVNSSLCAFLLMGTYAKKPGSHALCRENKTYVYNGPWILQYFLKLKLMLPILHFKNCQVLFGNYKI